MTMLHRSTGAPISLLFVALSTLAVSPLRAQVASFDCDQAKTAAERAICSSPELGRKDITVAAYYQLLLRLKPAAGGMAYREFDDRVRDAQRRWQQGDRRACGGDADCLNHAYDHRLDALLKSFDANAGLTFGQMID